jgi:phosphoribosylaminoimidazole-succinocarboxamide synthase
VRDVYEVDDRTLLMVASDRVSAFDVVMRQPIPRKGEVLTLITAWWLEQLEHIVPHHLIAVDPDRIVARHPASGRDARPVGRRAMLVQRTDPVLVECVVRGYISGSAWKEYERAERSRARRFRQGLHESERLDPPIFSPATKAQEGHDENIDFGSMCEILGSEPATHLRDLSLEIYGTAGTWPRSTGSSWPTRSSSSADARGNLAPHRRGADPGLLTLLAGGALRGRARPAVPRQAAHPRLARRPRRVGQDAAAARSSPDVVSAASERYRYVFERLVGMPLDDYPLPLFGEDR